MTEAVKAALSHDSEGITAVMLPGRFGESTAEELHCEHRLCPRGWMSNCSYSHSDDIEEVRCSLNQYIVLQSKIILHIGGLYEVDPTLFPGHVTY